MSTSTASAVELDGSAQQGQWRLLLSPPARGAWNMALDDALLARARATGETVLRIYTWSAPTLSLGRNQTAAGLYDLDRARSLGVDIVRRPTGGRAVLHHREITYSVTAPISDLSLQRSYARINELLLHALQALGVEAEIASARGRAPLPDSSPCFDVSTPGELTTGGRKLVGSAQWREDGALLQHGSILIDDDQPLLNQLMRVPQPSSARAPATLRESAARVPTPSELFSALANAVVVREDAEATHLTADAGLQSAAQERQTHYCSPDWTWRR